MFNNYNTSGRATVYIKSASSGKFLGRNMENNELISIINDATFNISFRDLNKEIKSKSNLLGYSDVHPDMLTIDPKSMSESTADLLFGKSRSKNKVLVPKTQTVIADDSGEVFLLSPHTGNVYVYDENRNKVKDVLIDEFVVAGLESGKRYVVSYYTEMVSDKTIYSCDGNIPYLRVEIINQVNVGDETRTMMITIPKVALQTTPTLDYNRNMITTLSLSFLIIGGQVEVSYF